LGGGGKVTLVGWGFVLLETLFPGVWGGEKKKWGGPFVQKSREIAKPTPVWFQRGPKIAPPRGVGGGKKKIGNYQHQEIFVRKTSIEKKEKPWGYEKPIQLDWDKGGDFPNSHK